ncbi:molybdate ABC transporter substrate-binding protein [Georgenia sp. TF02-10]|uniref:molybdate ABC transporter substrate-binding protein n=1 Tax=Georgenia sp. TF02-10 TaxID=2917725 RepID=UPI001FA6B2AA|nr:molybdate ABC transporter substrate-binding protein [Georgenia sp. TF02-10]UNX55170.1 molybdate ABC transporter substrate-binding protein [Georgenia sp. TF02-10]
MATPSAAGAGPATTVGPPGAMSRTGTSTSTSTSGRRLVRGRLVAAAALALLPALAACGGSAADPGTGAADWTAGTPAGTATEAAGESPSGELTVFAAASLTRVFTDIAETLEAQHPGVRVTFSFAGSADLVAQVGAGAPADVLATADETTMADAVAAGVVAAEPTIFAENVLTLVVPPGNPAGVTGLDASLDEAHLVVCAPQVPCGAATAQLADRAGVTLAPVSEESSVTDVLGKVTAGQADAGLVYTTDATAAGDAVEVIAVPGAAEVVNRYPLAVLADAEDPGLARLWVETVTGEQGRQVLADAGFRLP